MLLRKAEKDEFPTVQAFYWDLIDQMEGQKETVGWKKGIYPTDAFLKESIDNGELYVIDGSEGIIASVIVNSSWNEGHEGITWGIACPREEILVPHVRSRRSGRREGPFLERLSRSASGRIMPYAGGDLQ